MTYKNSLTKLLALVLAFMFSYGAAQAQYGSVLQFMAKPNTDNSGIHLYWYIESDKTLDKVEVMMAEKMIRDSSDFDNFEKAATLTDSDWEEKREYRAFIEKELDKSSYTLFLKAWFKDGKVVQSNWTYIRTSNYPPHRGIVFTTQPPFEAFAGEEYTYDADAEYTEDKTKEIVYSLSISPDGMTIDEETGEVSWTPDEAGYFTAKINAALKEDESINANQFLRLEVKNCRNAAVIQGEIKRKNGDPVKNGSAQLYHKSGNSSFNKALKLNDDGKFTQEVDKGSYYLAYYDYMTNLETWYKGANPRNGDPAPITVDCGETFNVIMEVETQDDWTYHTITGNVSYDNGDPIENALVTFENTIGRDMGMRGKTFQTYTDKDGNYSVKVPEQFKYITYAMVQNNMYMKPLFYDQTFNRNEAEVLEFENDRSGIDFVFDESNQVNYCEVSGTVTDNNGNPVEGIEVYFEIQVSDRDSIIMIPMRRLSAKTDADGNYSIKLPDAFKYYAYIVNKDLGLFQPYFYENTYKRDEATLIELTGNRDDIDFQLKDLDFETYTVSGNVSLKDGTPVEGAMVVFEGFTGDRDKYYGHYQKTVTTDADGNYSVDLPDMFKYTAYAIDKSNRMGCMRPLFYDQTYNPDKAAVIELTADRDDIDFVFENPYADYSALISGQVTNESDDPIANVFMGAFLVRDNNDRFSYEGRAALADDEGNFKFENLRPGKYVLFAFPQDGNYIPGFYKEGTIAVMSWDEATQIEVEKDEEITDVQVILGEMSDMVGNSEVDGIVRSNGQMADAYIFGDVIAGANIYVKNDEGQVISHTQTNQDGTFRLQRMMPGEYMMIVDKVGFKKHTQMIEVDEDANMDIGEIRLVPDAVSGIGDDIKPYEGMDVYPNPANNKVTVRFDGNAGTAKLMIVDAMGNEIHSETVEANNGMNDFNLRTADLSSGSYFIKINNGSSIMIAPLMVTH